MDTLHGGGEVTNVISKLYEWDQEVVECWGLQMDLNAKIMSAINRLNSSGDSGSPCLRPMDVVKV